MLSLLLVFTASAADYDVRWRPGPPPPRPPRPPPARVAPPPPPDQHDVSLTFDPVALTQGIAVFDGEIRAGQRSGVDLTGGLGARDNTLLYKVGVEGRAYFVGDFDAGLYVGLGVDGANQHYFLPDADALSVGPSLGGKVTFPVLPLTLQASVGADLVVAEEFVAVAPTFGVGVGFSF